MWPSVSIGIPTYNRGLLVKQAINSVLKQDYPGKIEIVVADDGSTDGTVHTVTSQYARFRERVRVLPGAHGGIARAKNRALFGGTGEIRGILDSDDYYEPGFVSACVRALLSNPGVGLAYTDNYLASGKGPKIVQPALDWSLDEFLRTCNLRGDCWLARWDVLSRAKHDEAFLMEVDYDLFYQLAEITEFRRVPLPLQTVRVHSGQTTKNRLTAAYWHAAGLGKYGHPIEHALERARRARAEMAWGTAIRDGYEFGRALGRIPPSRVDLNPVFTPLRGDSRGVRGPGGIPGTPN